MTALFPSESDPGTYDLAGDNSTQEWKRGEGMYRLYLGFNRKVLSPPVEVGSLPY